MRTSYLGANFGRQEGTRRSRPVIAQWRPESVSVAFASAQFGRERPLSIKCLRPPAFPGARRRKGRWRRRAPRTLGAKRYRRHSSDSPSQTACLDFVCATLGAAKFPGSTYATRPNGDLWRAPYCEIEPSRDEIARSPAALRRRSRHASNYFACRAKAGRRSRGIKKRQAEISGRLPRKRPICGPFSGQISSIFPQVT